MCVLPLIYLNLIFSHLDPLDQQLVQLVPVHPGNAPHQAGHTRRSVIRQPPDTEDVQQSSVLAPLGQAATKYPPQCKGMANILQN